MFWNSFTLLSAKMIACRINGIKSISEDANDKCNDIREIIDELEYDVTQDRPFYNDVVTLCDYWKNLSTILNRLEFRIKLVVLAARCLKITKHSVICDLQSNFSKLKLEMTIIDTKLSKIRSEFNALEIKPVEGNAINVWWFGSLIKV